MTPLMLRTAGLATLVGGAIVALSTILHAIVFGLSYDLAEVTGTTEWLALAALGFPGALLVLLGLPGVHARQAAQSGAFGVVAYAALFVALALNFIGAAVQFAFLPVFAEHAPHVYALDPLPLTMGIAFLAMSVSMALGFLLFSIATIRARVYSRAVGYALVAGLLLNFVPVTGLGKVVSAAAIAWMGWELWRASAGAAEVVPSRRESPA